MIKRPRCCPFSTCRRFKPPNCLASYGNPHPGPPLTTIKASTPAAPFVLSCRFGPAWDSTAHAGNLIFVSQRSFPTFLACACHHLSPHWNQVLGGGSFCFDKMAWVQQCWKEINGGELADFTVGYYALNLIFILKKKKKANPEGDGS